MFVFVFSRPTTGGATPAHGGGGSGSGGKKPC